MKQYCFYLGCLMPTEQYAYELSIRETLPHLDIQLTDLPGASCCGEPMKSINQLMTLYLSARNIALAEKKSLDIFAPCAMCHLALTECQHIFQHNESIKNRINSLLAKEDLEMKGTNNILHTVDLLHDVVGLDVLKNAVKKPVDLKVATHYGCHLIRPSEIGRPVDSENPQKMENILKALGATPVDYPQKLDCCGAPILAHLPESALTKTGQKLQAIQDQGFDALVTVCPWCQKMFDTRQQKAGEIIAATLNIPIFYLPQLLGLALGIDEKKLGLHLNQSSVNSINLGGR
jgi:heterodisulfide reductase subunit B